MKNIKHLLPITSLVFFLFSCSTGNKPSSVNELGSYSQNANLETIAVLGTNDLHGALVPFSLQTREQGASESVPYEAGGAAVLANYIQILRSEFGDHMLWLDAGDEFQGSIESNLEKGAPMVEFLNASGLNAAAVGNHEFDFGLDSLKSRMSEAKYRYLTPNILEKKSGNLASFPHSSPHMLLQAGNLKIGIIGLSTLDTPKTTRAINVESLQFADLKATTLKEAQELREQGAHVILLVAHSGLKCDSGHSSVNRMWKVTDPQGECGDGDEIVELLKSLPSGSVDAVVSGHTHQIVHHWVAGVPVIQGGAFGRYFNVVYLTYDWSQKKLLPDQTRIEGPVPVCEQVFRNQNDCNGDRLPPRTGRGPQVPAKFHGQTIEPDRKIIRLLKNVVNKTKAHKEKVLGTAVLPIENARMAESELGNLVADAVLKSVNADFSYINSGGIRSPLEAGPITYGSVFRSIPFDNAIATVRVKAHELRKFLQIAESGARGFGSISGLRLRLIDPAFEAPFVDLSGDGKYELWKVNRILGMTLPDGQSLDSEKLYTLATLDFLVTGGDDLKWAMSQIPQDRIQIHSDKIVRDIVVQYIEGLKVINSPTQPLIDKISPRLKFEKLKMTSHSKRKHRRKK